MKKAKLILKIVGIMLFAVDLVFMSLYFATRNYDFRTVSDIVNYTFWIVMFLAVFLPEKKTIDNNTVENAQNKFYKK